MPALLPAGNHLFGSLHEHPVWREEGDGCVAAGQVRVPGAGDPTGWGQPHSRGQKGAVLLPAAAPAQVPGVTCAGAVGGAQRRWHRLRDTGTLGALVRLLPSISNMAQITPNCLYFEEFVSVCAVFPTSLLLPCHSSWSHRNLRFDTALLDDQPGVQINYQL